MKSLPSIALLLVFSFTAHAASMVDSIREHWSQPVEPYQVIDTIYYVGASGISSHIIKTSEGLILLDAGTTLMVPQIQRNIEKLGFNIHDVKLILSSHAHWDHVEGLAEMKKRTGASVAALGKDAEAIADGIDNSALGGDGWDPVAVDRIFQDGDTISLGDVSLKAYLTPGHTKGCTTWTMKVEDDGKTYGVVFIGGTTINMGVNLIGNTRHPGILEDYATTFRVLKSLKADVFLSQHPTMHNMDEKRQKLNSGSGANPFIDPEGYRQFIQREEEKYLKQVKREESKQ